MLLRLKDKVYIAAPMNSLHFHFMNHICMYSSPLCTMLYMLNSWPTVTHMQASLFLFTYMSVLLKSHTVLYFRLPTSSLLRELHSQLRQAPLHPHLLLPRELQPLPEVHLVLLSGAHCVPSLSGHQHLQWVHCGVHHQQPGEV